jgi:hypothetical protein
MVARSQFILMGKNRKLTRKILSSERLATGKIMKNKDCMANYLFSSPNTQTNRMCIM